MLTKFYLYKIISLYNINLYKIKNIIRIIKNSNNNK